MTKTNAPTMKDVAKEAGVSLGTVSKCEILHTGNGLFPIGNFSRCL